MITFPLYPIERDAEGDPYCPCPKEACKGVGKHPAVADWTRLDESVPVTGQGWGVLTGHEFFVLDVDPKNGGAESYAKLQALPETYRVRSGSGGWHDYFKVPAGFVAHSSIGKLGPGLDILGLGKYVVGAGSPHVLGAYEVERDVPMADPPAWLTDWIARNASVRGHVTAEAWTPVAQDDPTYAARVQEQVALFKRAPVFKTGGGKHRYVILLQNAGPGLLLDEETTVKNFKEHYDPRLGSDAWFPDHEDEFRSEVLRRAWACSMSEGAVPNAKWVQHEFFAQRAEAVKATQAEGQELGSRVPGEIKKKSLTDAAQFLASHEDWKGVFRYDVFKDAIVAVGAPFPLDVAEGRGLTAEDVTRIRAWFEFREYGVTAETVETIVRTLAKEHSFHPVRDYLAGLPVRGPDVFDGLSKRLFGSENVAHDDLILRKFFTAAYARIASPGVKHDAILVLYGRQGIRKSTFVKDMFSPWYRDQMPDLASRDGSMALEGHWGIELGELDKMQKLDTSTVKDFLSRSVDRYRGFGVKDKVEAARQCVFVGTTNDHEFLQDITGNRRFWILEVQTTIPEITKALRDDIWSAAKTCYEYGERWWLDETEEQLAESVRKRFEIVDPWQNRVKEIVRKLAKPEITTSEVLEALFTSGLPDLKSINNAGMKRVARCLKALGWRQERTENRRFWTQKQETKATVIPFPGKS